MTWDRFKQYYLQLDEIGFSIDISRVNFPATFIDSIREPMTRAFEQMRELEAGAIANPDEKRMVGHYWLRNPALAPDPGLTSAIEDSLREIRSFVNKVHSGDIRGSKGPFKKILCIGIGGSALGPQFVAHALGHPQKNNLAPYFIDNTDPDGIDSILAELRGSLGETLVIVISKSGGTPEPRNAMLEVEAAYKADGLSFARHAVCVTGHGSALDQLAIKNGWLARFAMFDWVGGRTSELSAVGLLPAALQGIDIDGMLRGARDMDVITRRDSIESNPAAQLAAMWYHITGGKGEKDMVVLPYKDRLLLFSRYLQQLVMESLGKEKDLEGNVVEQGIAVYGNKGSTDQHAYVQQLRDGINNFFVTFIEVLKDRNGPSIEIEEDVTSGDYLRGFLLGTRDALSEKNRDSITLTVRDVTPYSIGLLIALYERAVGLYAYLIGINAYHQPGVEAGKKAAAEIIQLKASVLQYLRSHPGKSLSAEELAAELELESKTEIIFKLLLSLSANPGKDMILTNRELFPQTRFIYQL